MKLKKLCLDNYRNINNSEFAFSDTINYIAGENNIGKSNLLNAINKLFTGKSFSKDDFFDLEKSIVINFSLSLSEEEIGIFDDLVDPTETNLINIVAEQKEPDDYITYKHFETEQFISLTNIKKMNLINYDSLRNPKNELDFSKTKGAGTFLNYIVNNYIDKNEESRSFLNSSEIGQLESYAVGLLNNISAIERFGISPKIEENSKEMLSRIFVLKDQNNISISDTGYGVQFNLLLILSILEKLIDYKKKANDTENTFSTLMIFDEPEIHLHPFLQRAIIKDLLMIAEGKDEKFKDIISELFKIDLFDGQIIVVTHSPNMIERDYKKIIRMYREDNKVNVVSGVNLNLTSQDNKQLNMQFEFVKEAIFAKVVVIVEGESEFSAIREFAQKLNIDFDRENIALIKAGGAESIRPLMNMFEKFGIRSIGIIDQDKKIEKSLPDSDVLFYTQTLCFDSEIVTNLLSNGKLNKLESVLELYDNQGKERRMQEKCLNKYIEHFKKNVIADRDYKFSELTPDDVLLEIMYISWFSVNKGITLGKVIGQVLDLDDIPECYINAINKAKELTC